MGHDVVHIFIPQQLSVGVTIFSFYGTYVFSLAVLRTFYGMVQGYAHALGLHLTEPTIIAAAVLFFAVLAIMLCGKPMFLDLFQPWCGGWETKTRETEGEPECEAEVVSSEEAGQGGRSSATRDTQLSPRWDRTILPGSSIRVILAKTLDRRFLRGEHIFQ